MKDLNKKKGERRARTDHCSKRHVEAVNPCQAKVSQLQLTILGDEKVLGFQISMDDAVTVQEIDTVQKLQHQVLQQ